MVLWVNTSSEERGAAIFRVQVSGAGIGVGNVGRMEGLYIEGKSGRACNWRRDRAYYIQTTATINRNASTENGPGLLVINVDPNGRVCLILREKLVH